MNYDGFIDDVAVGDIILVDGGIMSMRVTSMSDTDVVTEVIDGGILKSRRHLNIRGKSANLPAITEKDWEDIRFGCDMGVDYFALSFVRDANAIVELKQWLATYVSSRSDRKSESGVGNDAEMASGSLASGRSATISDDDTMIQVLAKIESADSVTNLDAILDAADGAMVARGDLGAELPIEEVPFWQYEIVKGCHRRKKPVIVATNMLESMIEMPVPTRAEVADISVAVREGTDAVMLSGETAYGKFPLKVILRRFQINDMGV